MEKSDIYLSVIIPTYNEGERIAKTLRVIFKYLEDQDFAWEIIVVSSASTDNTVDVVQDSKGVIPGVRLINLKENRGKGFAVKEGMLAARGKVRLFSDADNSTDISHFDKMKPFFDRGYEVVIGSRESKDAPGARQAVSQPLYRRLLGDFGNVIIRLVAVRGIRDTQCGFKAFTADAAEKIFSRLTIERWGFDIEVLAMSRLFGYRIAIIPVYWINDPKSHVKPSAYIEVLYETFKIRLNLLRGVYKNDGRI